MCRLTQQINNYKANWGGGRRDMARVGNLKQKSSKWTLI